MLSFISIVVFNILSLSSIFVSLITISHSVFLLGFILPGTLCTSWTLFTISFPMFRKFSAIISSNIFSGSLSLSSSGAPIMQILVHLMLFQRSLRLSLFLSIVPPSRVYSASVISHTLPPCHSSVLLPQLFCY